MKLKTANRQRKANETQARFFEKINKINRSITNISKKKSADTNY